MSSIRRILDEITSTSSQAQDDEIPYSLSTPAFTGPQCDTDLFSALSNKEVIVEINRLDDHVDSNLEKLRGDLKRLEKDMKAGLKRKFSPADENLRKTLKSLATENAEMRDVCRRSLDATLDISKSLELKLQKMEAIMEDMAYEQSPTKRLMRTGKSPSAPLTKNKPKSIKTIAKPVSKPTTYDVSTCHEIAWDSDFSGIDSDMEETLTEELNYQCSQRASTQRSFTLR